MSDIRVNLDALTRDATAWDCVADRLKDIDELLASATVRARDFMAVSGSENAEAVTMSALAAIQGFAQGGASETRRGADVLRWVRDRYRDHEEEARATLDGLWEPDED